MDAINLLMLDTLIAAILAISAIIEYKEPVPTVITVAAPVAPVANSQQLSVPTSSTATVVWFPTTVAQPTPKD